MQLGIFTVLQTIGGFKLALTFCKDLQICKGLLEKSFFGTIQVVPLKTYQ